MEKPWELGERTILFAVSMIRFCRALPRTAEAAEIASQLRRAAGSVGAHYSAAKRNRSSRDFIAKMGGAIEEGDECMLWLDVLVRADIARDETARPLRSEANELISIFIASRTTAIRRAARKRRARFRAAKQQEP